MFKKIVFELRMIYGAIGLLGETVRVSSEALREGSAGGADPERLSALEGRMEVVLGQVEAGIVKADSLKSAARAAEDRTRGHMKRAEGYLELAKGIEGSEASDPFERAAEDWERELSEGNDAAQSALPPVPNGVEGRRESLARVRAFKRGV